MISQIVYLLLFLAVGDGDAFSSVIQTTPSRSSSSLSIRTITPSVLPKSKRRLTTFTAVYGSFQSDNQEDALHDRIQNNATEANDFGEAKDDHGWMTHHRMARRDVMAATSLAASLVASSFLPQPALAASTTTASVPFGASWRAVDGLNNLNNEQNFVAFDAKAYQAMRDDPTRTPVFEKAIQQRLAAYEKNTQVALDLGTGPFALFAIIAAENGAKKVYAVEANPEAAKSARALVEKRGFANVIEIVEGFSSQLDALPELVDFCMAEIVGSIASEEGAYATIRDSHRFLKNPTLPENWIPSRIQTYAAPASYTLHNLLGPPAFDWTKLQGEPVRFNCRDLGLELLSDPVLIEDISFHELGPANNPQPRKEKQQLTFTVDPERLEDNEDAFLTEFKRDGTRTPRDAEALAYQTAHSFTGIACWPRLIVAPDLVVNSRKYGTGDHQRSHWQTVLPIMAGRPIGGLKGNEKVRVNMDFTLPNDVTVPPSYKIDGFVDVV